MLADGEHAPVERLGLGGAAQPLADMGQFV